MFPNMKSLLLQQLPFVGSRMVVANDGFSGIFKFTTFSWAFTTRNVQDVN